jgi:ribosomal protein S18 acetylase RimI-like enzyme
VQCITHEAGARVSVAVKIQAVPAGDRELFMQMAERHFRDLNPAFTPHPDWREHYFNRIQSNANLHLGWVTSDDRRAGFILYGFEEHRFLPRKTGAIYELYIEPEFRKRGIARAAAQQAISELKAGGPTKIQLEIIEGNVAAEKLWLSLGFERVTARYVLGVKTQ